MTYLTVPLNPAHKKQDFSCGKELLNNYLHKQAKQDVKRKLSACFVLATEDNLVQGYYTLSSATIPRDLLPDEYKKKLPSSYTDVPATLLGRLAVDISFKGKGFGELLLLEALKKCYDASVSTIGSVAVIVEPIDEEAEKFYYKYGFIKLSDSGKMFIPMDTVIALFK